MISSCSATSPWRFESIKTGEELFDSARLIYTDPSSSLRFEIVSLGTEIISFLSLTKYQFTPRDEVKMLFNIEGDRLEETIPLLEGRMRLRLPPQLSEKIILGLQEGKKIEISLDGFEQHLDPAHFAFQYEKLTQKNSFQNPFKGLFEP